MPTHTLGWAHTGGRKVRAGEKQTEIWKVSDVRQRQRGARQGDVIANKRKGDKEGSKTQPEEHLDKCVFSDSQGRAACSCMGR